MQTVLSVLSRCRCHASHLCHRERSKERSDDGQNVAPNRASRSAVRERHNKPDDRDDPSVSQHQRVSKDGKETEVSLGHRRMSVVCKELI